MISGTYILSGVLLAVTAYLFDQGVLTAITQTLAWCVIFFLASAGASAAYLTVSEIFPLEVRAQAISVFFAIAQCFGAVGPVLYGHLIGRRRPSPHETLAESTDQSGINRLAIRREDLPAPQTSFRAMRDRRVRSSHSPITGRLHGPHMNGRHSLRSCLK